MAVFIHVGRIMAFSDKQLAVLELLKRQKTPVGLPDLLKLLDESVPDRTVRRWLSLMVEAGVVEKTGQKRGTRYRALPEKQTAVATAPLDEIFSAQSQIAIEAVKQPIFKKQPVTYHLDWLRSYKPNQDFYLGASLRSHLFEKGFRADNHNVAGTYARKIHNRLLIDLSYHSSRLEGNTYSQIDTEKLIIEGVTIEGKLDEERVMILNHKEAIRHLIDSAKTITIDADQICTLHYLLADGLVGNQHAGKFRDQGVRIGASTYVPLENKTQLQTNLDEICRLAQMINDPYEQSFFLLTHIAYLQAFVDVNKRTSRLSANIPLIIHNLVPLSFNDISQDDYTFAMLAIYELNNTQPLADLYRYSYLRTCQQYDVTVESMGYDEIRVRYRQQRRELIREIIVEELVGLSLDERVAEKTKSLVASEHQLAFVEDVKDDLANMNYQRIVGMGVTKSELDNWLLKFKQD